MATVQTLRLRAGARLDPEGPAFVLGMARLPFTDPAPATTEALEALAGPGLDAGTLTGDPAVGLLITRLESGGWLARTVATDGGRPLATREPLAFADVLERRGFSPTDELRLSRLALLGLDDGEPVLESGAALARVTFHEPHLAALVGQLAQPLKVEDLDPESLGLEGDQLDAVLRLLLQARLIRRVEDGPDPERDEQELAQWSALDLLFHARTRLGRRGGSYGGTYPFAERFPEPPAIRPGADDERIALPQPDLDGALESDPPLASVVEARRSIREHDDENPITVEQLSELLFRTNRIRGTVDTESHGSFALRPYPNGGALYELDLYPAVRLCEGLAAGLYRHDPVEHALVPVAADGPMLKGLLGHARAAALMEQQPQVLLVIAARFPRVSWKYEAMPYALTLKHVGVVYQTLYLAATAMGLAPCGLGGGDSDLFARAAGLDYAAETSVGEFIVGSRPEGSTGPGIEAVAAPTPDY